MKARAWIGTLGLCLVALWALLCVDNRAEARPAQHHAVAAGAATQGVSLGYQHACAVGLDGQVWCWGANDSGQLGRGNETAMETVPAPVVGLQNAISVSVGLDHSCALRRDGTVWCWGDNTYGQLGDGTYISSDEPVAAGALYMDWPVAVVAGEHHTCAISDGSVYCWGDNSSHQVNSTGASSIPNPAYAGLEATALFSSASSQHTCALSGSQVTCWGANDSGQSGAPLDSPTTPPVQLSLSGPATSLATGMDFSCALLASGSVQCWGNNIEGQLGVGQTSTPSVTPQDVLLGSNGCRIHATERGRHHWQLVPRRGGRLLHLRPVHGRRQAPLLG